MASNNKTVFCQKSFSKQRDMSDGNSAPLPAVFTDNIIAIAHKSVKVSIVLYKKLLIMTPWKPVISGRKLTAFLVTRHSVLSVMLQVK